MMSARLVSTFALISIAFTPANAEVIRDEDGPMIGAFKVGDWGGRCRRDGWLAGANSESCGAQLDGAVEIRLGRTYKGLTVTTAAEGCNKTVSVKMNNKALAAKNRAERLETLMRGAVSKIIKKCKDPQLDIAHEIKRADLVDILNETDGLEF
ncbi:MAG: hypothetical protein IPN50_04850 [Sphingomonadales bacterium]|jgi:hypothetical protein|uniref:hypothetical protein n=3 Tax=Sphingorhabdus sp. TaxID=1902408 RepID=UPI003BAE2D62|nr:hypothetical protein [Sphingomonadales bacterium]MBK9431759.1 hypothetical protein [Sphingomonadales bacterium]